MNRGAPPDIRWEPHSFSIRLSLCIDFIYREDC